jgi:hypothetical protein
MEGTLDPPKTKLIFFMKNFHAGVIDYPSKRKDILNSP